MDEVTNGEITPVAATDTQIQTQPTNDVMGLLSNAVNKGLPVETLEKLLDMKERIDATQAKKDFDAAMSQLQSELPVVKKTKSVKDKNKKLRYKFASMDSIISQTKDIIGKHGFSFSITVEQTEKMITAICTVKHSSGHSEQTKFAIPYETNEYMTQIQRYASSLTFAKRYAFMNAFGIMTGDDDNDGNHEEEETTPQTKINKAGKVSTAPKNDTSGEKLITQPQIQILKKKMENGDIETISDEELESWTFKKALETIRGINR